MSFGSSGIGGFLERLIGGKSADIGPKFNGLTNTGIGQQAAGATTSAGAISGLEGDIAGWQKQINSGEFLTPAMQRAYGMAVGGVNDEASRSMAATRASIAQRRAASGGLFSDEAGAELGQLGDLSTEDQRFSAQRDIGISRANAEQGAQSDIFNRLDSARNNILNYGQFQQSLGSQNQINGLMGLLNRNKAIADTIAKTTGGIKGL